MAATSKTLDRVFKFEGTLIPDPSPSASPDRCLEILALAYPQFNNAAIDGPFYEGGKQVFQVKVETGTKG